MHWGGQQEFFFVDLVTFVDCKSYVTVSIDDIMDVFFQTLFNKIAAELFDKTHMRFEL